MHISEKHLECASFVRNNENFRANNKKTIENEIVREEDMKLL